MNVQTNLVLPHNEILFSAKKKQAINPQKDMEKPSLNAYY